MGRRLLGTASGVMTRARVYLSADAVEVDEIEGYTGTRRRVLLDEVLLVTLDRRRRWTTILIWTALGATFSLPALIVLSNTNEVAPAVVTGLVAAPFLLIALVHLLAGADFVTVFGKRTMAQMAFSMRKARARATFALLRDRVEQAQQAAGAPIGEPAAHGGGSSVA